MTWLRRATNLAFCACLIICTHLPLPPPPTVRSFAFVYGVVVQVIFVFEVFVTASILLWLDEKYEETIVQYNDKYFKSMAAIANTAVNSADYDSEPAPKRTASSSILKPEFPTPNLVSEKEDPCFSNSKSELGEDLSLIHI